MAAHRASALTLSAGLGGQGNPERPLQDLIDPFWHAVSPLFYLCEHETGFIDNEALYDIHFHTLKPATPDTWRSQPPRFRCNVWYHDVFALPWSAEL